MYQLAQLNVTTHDPDKYVLVNTKDGTVWNGTTKGWYGATHDQCFAARRALRLAMAAMKEK